MKSKNFDFLRPRWKELADLCGLAEQLAFIDPASTVVRLRVFVEQFTDFLYHHHSLPQAAQSKLNDRLHNSAFQQIIDNRVLTLLFSLKDFGNTGAHKAHKIKKKNAYWCLERAHEIASWLAMTIGGLAAVPEYSRVENAFADAAESKKEAKALRQRLEAESTKVQELLKELQEQRAKTKAVALSNEELQAELERGKTVADQLELNEAETRQYMIDQALVNAGWDVGERASANESPADTDQVKLEFPVTNPAQKSGAKLKADYVLFSGSGLPLAVIEAKRTSVDPANGRKQAEIYADGLELDFGFRPVIFYTNGLATWLLNDSENEPPREVYGFYSPDSLDHLVNFQRAQRKDLRMIELSADIAGRLYQLESIKRVLERFANRHRQALIVQATGTGKTRVAISISKALLDARWAKRILFLCDRKELRRQARNAFKQFLPNEARTVVTSKTADDRSKRIYFATYPAMMRCFRSFDVGFFDLIIADESHRSIYNRYRELVLYFDALVIGLTATPVSFITRNTFQLFGCEDEDPTAKYEYEEAIGDSPPSLVPYTVESVTTEFLRKGIKYSEMSEAQRQSLEESELDPEEIEFEKTQIDNQVINLDTNRVILRNLMDHGLRDENGQNIGKTIIFARNVLHARTLEKLFNEVYPQYGGHFCRTIVSEDPRASDLIDDFKGDGNNPNLTIAISVDMLDTGLDVPEIVNLVFAKPVYSKVKFWQMIGRGTRLCMDLFGPGRHKTHFAIFDHWQNFQHFDVSEGEEREPARVKSLSERLFCERLQFAEACQERKVGAGFELAVQHLMSDLKALPSDSISVKEKWKDVEHVQKTGVLKNFSAGTRARLLNDIAPLMQWRNISGDEAALKFDVLMTKIQTAKVSGSSEFDKLILKLREELQRLPMNLSQIKEKQELIDKLMSSDYWEVVTVGELDQARLELRDLMRLQNKDPKVKRVVRVIDVQESEAGTRREEVELKAPTLKFAAYRARVEKVLMSLFESSVVLQKIKRGEPVGEPELEELASLVLAQDSQLNLQDLQRYYPETTAALDTLIRSIVGMEAHAVDARFSEFARTYKLTAQQTKFLGMLKNHLKLYGTIDLDMLWESPFTTLDSDGVTGVFTDESQIDELLDIIKGFGELGDIQVT